MSLACDYIYQKIKHKFNASIPEYNIKSLIMLSPMADPATLIHTKNI